MILLVYVAAGPCAGRLTCRNVYLYRGGGKLRIVSVGQLILGTLKLHILYLAHSGIKLWSADPTLNEVEMSCTSSLEIWLAWLSTEHSCTKCLNRRSSGDPPDRHRDYVHRIRLAVMSGSESSLLQLQLIIRTHIMRPQMRPQDGSAALPIRATNGERLFEPLLVRGGLDGSVHR